MGNRSLALPGESTEVAVARRVVLFKLDPAIFPRDLRSISSSLCELCHFLVLTSLRATY